MQFVITSLTRRKGPRNRITFKFHRLESNGIVLDIWLTEFFCRQMKESQNLRSSGCSSTVR